MIPILPAKEVRMVLPFFVKRFLSERAKEVPQDIEGFFLAFLFALYSA